MAHAPRQPETFEPSVTMGNTDYTYLTESEAGDLLADPFQILPYVQKLQADGVLQPPVGAKLITNSSEFKFMGAWAAASRRTCHATPECCKTPR